MKFIINPLIEYEKSLQVQDDSLPIWLSSKERPNFNWSDVYSKDGKVINYYKDPVTGNDNFDECSQQLRLLFDYIIQIDQDKFTNLWDLRQNINNNLIILKDKERADPEAPKVSDLNVRAVFSQIKPTLEKYLLMLKYEHSIISKEKIESFNFAACFSGASSNLNNMMEIFHNNKITAHAYRTFKEYIRQKAVEFCKDSGIIDQYNYGNEIHYVNYFVNKLLEISNLKPEIDELIPPNDSFLNEKLSSFLSLNFKTTEIIENIIMQWPLFDKDRWSYEDIKSFFSYYENTEKSFDDKDLNYWQIMFDLDETTYEFTPKNKIRALYILYVVYILSREKLMALSFIELTNGEDSFKILKNTVEGYIFCYTDSGFSLFNENKNFENIIFENIDSIAFKFCIKTLYKNFDRSKHFLLTQKIIEMNHPGLYDFIGLLGIQSNLDFNDFKLILEQSPTRLLENFITQSILNDDDYLIDYLDKISEESRIVKNKISEIINNFVEMDNVKFVFSIANLSIWSVSKEYIYETCIRGIYQDDSYTIIYALNFNEINGLSDDQISNIVIAIINEGKWKILDDIFSSTNIISKIQNSLEQILNDLFDNYIIGKNERELIFNIIAKIVIIKYRDEKIVDLMSNKIAKLFSSGLIEDGLKIFNVAYNNNLDEKVIFHFMRQTMNNIGCVNNALIQNNSRVNNYKFELSLRNLNATKKLIFEYLETKKIKRLSNEEDNTTHLNYYIAIKIVLGLFSPAKMNFLLDFKLKEANDYINKYLNLNFKDIDPELQSIIDKAKSWKRRKSPIKN